ncbi:VanZ family protein [Herbidospora cretacea]|uniref:VanZ family protein n=1 Tax=Herbidospora cretacea TaxID=28444 RepID=UPI000772D886|nr:VanZ family protein [Herbidospora cretacea]
MNHFVVVAPLILIVAVVVSTVVFFAVRRRFADFLLTGAAVTFVLVTQVMPYGGETGHHLNLEPLRHLRVALEHGVVSAPPLTQVLLNILLTVPIGVLLPIVFPERFGRLRVVFAAGLVVSVMTEGVQYLTGRQADLDDVLANTAGAVLGAALVLLVRRRSVRSAALSVVVVVAPMAAVYVIDTPGSVHYWSIRASAVRVPEGISSRGSTAVLYRHSDAESQEQTMARLRAHLEEPLNCEDQSGDLVCSDGRLTRLAVHRWNTWSYLTDPGSTAGPAVAMIERTAEDRAARHLAVMGVDIGTLTFVEARADPVSDRMTVTFESSVEQLWGRVHVTLDGDGDLAAVQDGRIPMRVVERVETRSPRSAIDIAQDLGDGPASGVAVVRSVEIDHEFDEESGYLIPVWRIRGILTTADGRRVDWAPAIDARS